MCLAPTNTMKPIEKLPQSNKLTTTEIDLIKEKINEIIDVVNSIDDELEWLGKFVYDRYVDEVV